jgi:hypothetical protein
MLLTASECSRIIAYNELQCQRVINESGIASYIPHTATGGDARPMRTFKLSYVGGDELVRVSIEDNLEVFEAVLSKSDYVLFQILLRSSLPYITGFHDVYSSARVFDVSAAGASYWE